MIDNLSSYIELFAAVYLTISLDDLLLKRFWTPDYKQKMDDAFKSIGMPELAKSQTLERASQISSIEETRSRKRGVILFSFSVLLLILIGLEDGFGFSNTNTEAIGIVFTAFLYYIVFIFDGIFLKTGWRVLFYVFCTPLVVVCSGCLLMSNSPTKAFLQSSVGKLAFLSKVVIVLALLTPVLWQLFRNWIYTRYYLLYIVEQTTIKTEEYTYAVNFDTSKGNKMTKVAKPYMDFVAETIAQKNQDRAITNYLNTFFSELSSINYAPNILPLLRYSFLMHKKYYPSKRRLHILSKKYDAAGSNGKKPPLEDFCKWNNVSLLLLKEYRKNI